jgi:hypothetical protein
MRGRYAPPRLAIDHPVEDRRLVEFIRRLVFIVARERKDLYTSLTRTFADDPTVEVVLDRRGGERRRAAATPTTDRRRRDRRVNEDVERAVRERGYAVVGAVRPRARRTP